MKILLLSLTLIISINTYGQTKFSYRDLEKMNRVAIINLAKEKIDNFVKLLNDTTFTYSLIDTIKILKNPHKKKYIVNFVRYIQFVPQNTSFYYGYTVDLTEDRIDLHMGLNSGRTDAPLRFFHPTVEDQEKIEFVLKALKQEKVQTYIIILEKDTFYQIDYGPCGEKVDKKTGKRSDSWDEIIIVDPKDEFIETKLK